MLSMVAVSVRKDRQKYYLQLSHEDYYVRAGEPLGEWVGRGAARLGLVGTIDGYEFLSLLDGKGRDGETPLVDVRRGAAHDPGWDLTFSAPKGVSLLWAVADEATRTVVEGCLKAAVADTVTYIEDTYKLARRGPQGRRREHAQLVASAFLHGTSRELDPNLHLHLLLMNAAVRADGTTGAILSQPLFDDRNHLGHVFRYAFAGRLQHNLGPEVYWYEQDLFDVVGVPEQAKLAMSQRSAQIRALMAAQGVDSAQAAAMAALATRRPKEMQAREVLFARWEQELRTLGFGREQAVALLHRVQREQSQEQTRRQELPTTTVAPSHELPAMPEPVAPAHELRADPECGPAGPLTPSEVPLDATVEPAQRPSSTAHLPVADEAQRELGPAPLAPRVTPEPLGGYPAAEAEPAAADAPRRLEPEPASSAAQPSAEETGRNRRGAEATSEDPAEAMHADHGEQSVRDRLEALAEEQGGFTHQEAVTAAMRATRDRPLLFDRLGDAIFAAAADLRLWLEDWRATWIYAKADYLRGVRDTLLEQAEALSQRTDAGVPLASLAPSVYRQSLSEERREAFDHLVERGSRLRIIEGPLNADAYASLREAAHVWELAGHNVHMILPTREAVEDFKNYTGMQAHTAWRWCRDLSEGLVHDALHHLWMLGRAASRLPTWAPDHQRLSINRNSVVFLVDAGGKRLADMAILMNRIHEHNAVAVVYGDPELRPLDQAVDPARPGLARVPNPYLDLRDVVGSRARVAPEQRLPEWRTAAQHGIHNGDAVGALARFAEHGRLTVTAEQPEAWQALLRDWRRHGARDPQNHLILAPDEAAARGLNRRAQGWRKTLDELGDICVMSGTDRIFARDRIQFARHLPSLGVAQGQLGTVLMAIPLGNSLVVRLDVCPPHPNTIDETKIVVVRAKDVQLGYAVTVLPGRPRRETHCYGLVDGRRLDLYRQISQAMGDLHLYLGLDQAHWSVQRALAAHCVDRPSQPQAHAEQQRAKQHRRRPQRQER